MNDMKTTGKISKETKTNCCCGVLWFLGQSLKQSSGNLYQVNQFNILNR